MRPDVEIDQVLANPLDQDGIASCPCKPVIPNAKYDDIRHCNPPRPAPITSNLSSLLHMLKIEKVTLADTYDGTEMELGVPVANQANANVAGPHDCCGE